jgi:hypothetical protein
VTAASTTDGSLAMAYLPATRTIKVDLSKLSGPIRARWYDPTDGTYTAIPLHAGAGVRKFTPPARNGDGDQDWVLVLDRA